MTEMVALCARQLAGRVSAQVCRCSERCGAACRRLATRTAVVMGGAVCGRLAVERALNAG